MEEREEKAVGKLPSLVPVTIDRLNERLYLDMLGDKRAAIEMHVQSLNELDVVSEDKLAEAEHRIRLSKDTVDFVNNFTEKVLAPYVEIINDIKGVSKGIIDKITKSNNDLKSRMIEFQRLNALKASSSIEKEKEEKLTTLANKVLLNEKVNIICKQLFARIFGGLGPKLDGSTSTFEPIMTLQKGKDFIEFVNAKFPNTDQYGEFSSIVEYSKNMGIKITNYIIKLLEAKKNGEDTVFYEQEIEKLRDTYLTKIDSDYLTARKTLETKIKKVNGETEKAIKQLTKGIVYTWDFNVDNTILVPLDFKSVDDKKVKHYITTNKEQLEAKLVKDITGVNVLPEQPIPGITIYKKETKRVS